jgi:PHD-finger
MTPRRSSRARTTQPSPALLQHTNSHNSNNSNSSGNSLSRGERNTRSNHKISSPQRSSTQRSQSLDESDGKPDLPQTRQRNRPQDDDNDDLSQPNEDEGDENDEEEVTRCLCGQQEYPGLPPSRRGATGRHRQAVTKDGATIPKEEPDPLSEELGSMFIQCDSCKVWQHGGCVGIMDEAMSPDEYYCEKCRKDLHRITSESNG